jgi:predicted enzyme related to lactoylglutathione lyase
MANPFVQVELVTQDLQKSRDFYSQLFDWKLEHVSMGAESYTLIGVGKDSGGVGGLMMKAPVAGVPTFWLSYVLVDDIRASTEKAKSLGATVIRDVTEVPAGWFSIIRDPQGAMLGLWKANSLTK